eukprot:gene29022-32219_t
MQSVFAQLGLSLKEIKSLGKGAFGEVSLCRVVETGELVACKRIYIRDATEGIPDNVVREIMSLQEVAHPNVVSLKDVQTKGSSVVLVMEYCCMDLQKALHALTSSLPEALIKGLMLQVLHGVKAVHEAGLGPLIPGEPRPSHTLPYTRPYFTLPHIAGLGPLIPGEPRPSHTLPYTRPYFTLPHIACLGPLIPGEPRPSHTLPYTRPYFTLPHIACLGPLIPGEPRPSHTLPYTRPYFTLPHIAGLGPLIPGENDIDQLGKTISLLGSIEPRWSGVEELPDWGKVSFPLSEGVPLSTQLPSASPAALELLEGMLRYNPEERITAEQALLDPYFFTQPYPAHTGDIAALEGGRKAKR